MSLVYVDEDPWLKEYGNCECLCSDLAIRVESYLNSGGVGSLAADITLRLRQCDQQLAQLRSSLFTDDPQRFITSEERERRQRCLEVLCDKARHIQRQFSVPKPPVTHAADANRDLLFGPSGNNIATQDRSNLEKTDTEVLRQRQTQILEEQDRGLEALSKIIARQKNIAHTIDNEVTSQTEIVTNLADSVGRVGARTEGATRRTTALIIHDNTCGISFDLAAILVRQ